eukprot:CAMPEP_0204862452 /NCGR_PEP_ID=MMETSP1348-20121228/2526_1 /ASSEMBLY_ACC=CAM_ASM_000700 /TAXON_ID=215587 /ORGANISM="Aplanochytrium stocchinoi, Strain GSBS06" /LENGTH=483 /DNA_ID=CAMNT_0052012403 /DNA_START=188 /DNA_END=1639 /DNA_ORIENTATION=-
MYNGGNPSCCGAQKKSGTVSGSSSESTAICEPETKVVKEKPLSVFRRELPVPPALGSFTSEAGRRLFAEALSNGTMEVYFALAEQFRTQDEPAYCGMTTLVMVLNTMAIDPGRIWKGPWRWFHEEQLSCCVSLDHVKKEGITIRQFACLAECNGAEAQIRCPDEFSLEHFRDDVRQICGRNGKERTLVVSYSRKLLGQTGDGHFSPIGGYNATADAVLIMDVARFKYPPHWVPLSLIYESMKLNDPSTGNSRGYIILSPKVYSATLLFLLRTRYEDWAVFATFLASLTKITEKCANEFCNDVLCSGCDCPTKVLEQESRIIEAYVNTENNIKQNWLNSFFEDIPCEVIESLSTFDEPFVHLDYRPRDHEIALEKIIEEVKSLYIYEMVKVAIQNKEQIMKQDRKAMTSGIGTVSKTKGEIRYMLSTVLFLAFPCCYSPNIDSSTKLQDVFETMRKDIEASLSPLLLHEIQNLRKQISTIIKMR